MSSHGRRVQGDFLGRAVLGATVLATFLVVLAWPSRASAYPWMLKHGYSQCASCHVDPMGGETLTGFGRVTSQTTLSTVWGDSPGPTSSAELLFGIDEPRDLRLGGSVRLMGLYELPKDGADGDSAFFPMQADVYGQIKAGPVHVAGSLGASRVPLGSPHGQPAQVTSNESGERPLNLVSRTHWIGIDVGEHAMIRAGRINLPFGVRIPEHVMWVREATRTDRESDQQHGLSLAYFRGKLRGEVMAVTGNYQIKPDKYRERGYSLAAEYLFADRLALGVSSLVTHAKEDRLFVDGTSNTRQAHGVTARWGPTRELAVLAEADVLLSSRGSAGYVGMLQGDFEVVQGLHGLLTGEVYDGGRRDSAAADGPGAGEPLLGGWVSLVWFFYTHFDLRADVVFRQESPVTIQSQFHFYF